MLCVTNRIVVPVSGHTPHQLLHIGPRRRIQRRKSLIHQQNLRLHDQRLGNRNPPAASRLKADPDTGAHPIPAISSASTKPAPSLAVRSAGGNISGPQLPEQAELLHLRPNVMLSSTVLSGNSEYFCGK
jgi:hypothetical protein